MTPSQMEAKAIDQVSKNQSHRDPKNVIVKSSMPFLDGTMYLLHWSSVKEQRDFDSDAFFKPGADDPIFLWGGEEMVRFVSTYSPGGSIHRTLKGLLSVDALGGVIALLTTGTVCYLGLQGGFDRIPKLIENGWMMILGFYFASAVKK